MKSLLTVLSSPERWTKGAYARDERGELAAEADGVCFCLFGALRHLKGKGDLTQDESLELYNELALKILRQKNHPSLVIYNDDPATTFEDVVAVIREAEAALAAKESAQ